MKNKTIYCGLESVFSPQSWFELWSVISLPKIGKNTIVKPWLNHVFFYPGSTIWLTIVNYGWTIPKKHGWTMVLFGRDSRPCLLKKWRMKQGRFWLTFPWYRKNTKFAFSCCLLWSLALALALYTIGLGLSMIETKSKANGVQCQGQGQWS